MMASDVKPKETTVSFNIAEPVKEKRPSVSKTGSPSDSSQPSASLPGQKSGLTPSNSKYDKEKKIGHRRVDDTGQVTYKKKPTSELMAAIQLGIGQSIGGLSSKPERDVLMQDFAVVDSVFFPSEGSNLTPAHHYSDFRFKTYAPMAFRYFREMFNIQPDDFLFSMCNEPMTELSNPGASGSVFYITSDDEFIIKTVQHKEAEFLQKLLPGYYMNLNQNPRTLLPKFYGLYCYQCGGKNIRFVVMNNLLPSTIRMHEKYDLKGSTYKRKASKRELAKKTPTLKDLDFADIHVNGILLEHETYTALQKTIQRDCRVLESFKIMDYSMLLGVHNLDQAEREKKERAEKQRQSEAGTSQSSDSLRQDSEGGGHANKGLQRAKSMKTRLASYSTALESIQAESDPIEVDDEDIPPGGIPARNSKGERLLLFIGVIDILQNYRLRKKMEHTFKSIVHDGDTISVHRPSFYANRFQSFFTGTVFRKIPSPLKHSPSKKKAYGRSRATSTAGQTELPEENNEKDKQEEAGAIGGRPDLLPETSTPPPPFEEATSGAPFSESRSQLTYTSPRGTVLSTSVEQRQSSEARTTSLYSPRGNGDHHARMTTSPVHSVSESTPTHTEMTEGTPSYTTSSPSLCSESLGSVSRSRLPLSVTCVTRAPGNRVPVAKTTSTTPNVDNRGQIRGPLMGVSRFSLPEKSPQNSCYSVVQIHARPEAITQQDISHDPSVGDVICPGGTGISGEQRRSAAGRTKLRKGRIDLVYDMTSNNPSNFVTPINNPVPRPREPTSTNPVHRPRSYPATTSKITMPTSRHDVHYELAVNTSHVRGSQELEDLREITSDGVDVESTAPEPEVTYL